MNMIGTTISTLHRVSGDTILSSHMANHLSNICFIYSISRSNNWRKIRVRKEYRSLVRVTIPKYDGLTIP